MGVYDKASLVQIPSGYKSGTLYSVLPANGDGDFTHTRASSATRVNKDGLIESVASGVPRLDYPLIDGVVQSCPALLLEPSRTNLSTNSESFDSWTNGGTYVTANQAVSPDGNTTADQLAKTASFQQIQNTATVVSGSDYSFSVFVKENTLDRITLRLASGSNDVRKCLDLSDLSVSDAGGNQTGFVETKVEKYPNGWYKYTVVATTGGTSLFMNIYAGKANITESGNIYIWGAQLELGDYPTSYIPTTTASVTRSADECNKTGVESLLGQTEGTLFLEFVPQNTSDLQIMFQIRTTGSTNVGQIDIRFQSGQIRALGSDNSGTTQFSIAGGSITAGTNYKAAIRYKTNDSKFYINGSSVGADTSCSFTSSTKQQISFAENLSSFLPSIKVKQAIVFDEALTDAELATLTS